MSTGFGGSNLVRIDFLSYVTRDLNTRSISTRPNSPVLVSASVVLEQCSILLVNLLVCVRATHSGRFVKVPALNIRH